METAETKTIEVVVNGAARTIPAGLKIDRLLEWLEIDPSRVAVELNGQIVRKPDWLAAPVHEGARVEVVWFVGGGTE
jgi:sulfur carrier protein